MYDDLTDSQFHDYFALGAPGLERVETRGETIYGPKSMTIEQASFNEDMDEDKSNKNSKGSEERDGHGDDGPHNPTHSMRDGRPGDRGGRNGTPLSRGRSVSESPDTDISRGREEGGARSRRIGNERDSPSMYTSSPEDARPLGRFGRESPLPSVIREDDKGNDLNLAQQMQRTCIEESGRQRINMFGRRVDNDISRSRGQSRGTVQDGRYRSLSLIHI